jgi:hypothetical protein
MSKGVMILFGIFGAFIGFIFGCLIELLSPDGFTCISTVSSTEAAAIASNLSLQLGCLIIVGIFTVISSLIGTAVGAVISNMNYSGKR